MELFLANVSSLEQPTWSALWSGFVYDDIGREGSDAIATLLRDLESGSTTPASAHLLGNYVIALRNSSDGTCSIMVDESAMHPLYFTETVGSDSLLTLVERSDRANIAIDELAIHEFLMHAYYEPEVLPVKGVRRLLGNELITIDSDGRTTIGRRQRSQRLNRSDESFVSSMRLLTKAYSGQKLGLDLTAGFDSRLNLACLFGNEADIDLSIAASAGHQDEVIPNLVADRLGLDFHLSEPCAADDISPQRLSNVVMLCDGMVSSVELMDRKARLLAGRVERGAALAVDGTGGELMRDHWLLQDFPMYGNRKANFEQLFSTRLIALSPTVLGLSPKAAATAQEATAAQLQRFEKNQLENNIATYDAIVIRRLVGQTGTLTGAIWRDTGLTSYSPFAEFERSEFAAQLPVRDRVMDGFHRRIIRTQLPEIADIPTNWGIRVGDNPAMLAYRYAHEFSRRATSKLWQRATRKRLLVMPKPGNQAAYLQAILASPEWKHALLVLSAHGLVTNPASIDQTSYDAVSRLLAAGVIMGAVDGTPVVQPEANRRAISTSGSVV